MAYYVGEDLKEKRGGMRLDKNCVVEVGGGMWLKYFTLSHVGFPVSHNVVQLIHLRLECVMFSESNFLFSVPAHFGQRRETLHVLCQNRQ